MRVLLTPLCVVVVIVVCFSTNRIGILKSALIAVDKCLQVVVAENRKQDKINPTQSLVDVDVFGVSNNWCNS